MIFFAIKSLVLYGIVFYNGNRSLGFGIWDLGLGYWVLGIEGSLSRSLALLCFALLCFVTWLVGLELGGFEKDWKVSRGVWGLEPGGLDLGLGDLGIVVYRVCGARKLRVGGWRSEIAKGILWVCGCVYECVSVGV